MGACIKGSFSLYFRQLFKGLSDAIVCIENGPVVSKIFNTLHEHFLGTYCVLSTHLAVGRNTKRSEKNLALESWQIPRRDKHRSGCPGERDLLS